MISKADRDQLIQIAKARAKQADREADARQQILRAEVVDLITAEYEARDKLWADAAVVAEEAAAKANAIIQARCTPPDSRLKAPTPQPNSCVTSPRSTATIHASATTRSPRRWHASPMTPPTSGGSSTHWVMWLQSRAHWQAGND